jgi:hypothetical protein
MVLLMRGP